MYAYFICKHIHHLQLTEQVLIEGLTVDGSGGDGIIIR
eukprot:COSAG03_NODE_696_length_6223_cov_445.253429_10_plen_38_part_00